MPYSTLGLPGVVAWRGTTRPVPQGGMELQDAYKVTQDCADAILVVDGDGVVRFANPAARELLGARVAPGRPFGMPVSSDATQELVVPLPSGARATVEMRVGDSSWDGKLARVVTLRDVSERLQARERIAQLNRVLLAIHDVGQLIARESDPVRLVEQTCGLLVQARGYVGAWIALGDGRAPATGFAAAGRSEGLEELERRVRRGDWPPCLDRMPGGAGGVRVCGRASECSECPLVAVQGAGVAVALQHDEVTFGMLGVLGTVSLVDDEQEQTLVVEVARDVAFALRDIERERQRAQAARDREALLKATQIVLGTDDFAVAARAIFDICKRQTGATAGYVAMRDGENERGVVFVDVGGVECTVDETLPMPIRGLRAVAYRENRTVFENAFPSSRHVDLLPTGHAPLRNVMFVPITLDGDVKGVIGLADKLGDFDEADASRAQNLGGVVALALDRTLHLEALQRRSAQHQQAQKVAQLGHWELEAASTAPRWSEEVYRIFGLTPDAPPPSFADHVHSEDLPVLQEAIRAGFEEGATFDLVFRIHRRGGELGWMRAIGEPVPGTDGRQRLFGTAQDVTDRMEVIDRLAASEQKLRLEKERAQQYLDVAAVVLLGLDAEGKITLLNRRGCEVLGLEAEEDALGQDWFQFVPGDQRDEVRALFRRVLDGLADARRVDGEILTTAGERKRIVWHNAEVRDNEGAVIGTLSSGEDVTERRAMEAQLAQADRLASMGMLAAGVAHEINNPLAFVLYALESLSREATGLLDAVRRPHVAVLAGNPSTSPEAFDDAMLAPKRLDDVKQRIDEALGGTRRIREIVRGLNTFSRVEAEERSPVDLRRVIDAAISMSFNEIKYRARLVKDFGDVPTIMGSEGRLSQVFLNLLINATHAIDEGDAERNEIRIRTWSEDGFACAQVSDTGCGIPRDHLQKLFDPFFSTKKAGKGSGLGLAISRSIIEGCGGTIDVESKVGRGTAFTIRLPLEEEPERSPASARPQDAESLPVTGRVLVVDDEDGIRAAMVRMLSQHETVQAASAEEAKRILERDQSFDLVLCDVMMPGLSGADLHAWLVETNPRLARQFAFISGGAFMPRIRDYLSKTDNIRIEKPFDVENFVRIVGMMVRAALSVAPSEPRSE